jgi:hypothetical protein
MKQNHCTIVTDERQNLDGNISNEIAQRSRFSSDTFYGFIK